MRLSTLIPLAATSLLASANPAPAPLFPSLFPVGPVDPIVSTALAAASIPAAAVPVVASAIATAPPIAPNNASPNLIPGLDILPTVLYDNLMAASNILGIVLALLNESGLTDAQMVKIRDLTSDLGLPGLDIGVDLGGTVTTLLVVAGPLLSPYE